MARKELRGKFQEENSDPRDHDRFSYEKDSSMFSEALEF